MSGKTNPCPPEGQSRQYTEESQRGGQMLQDGHSDIKHRRMLYVSLRSIPELTAKIVGQKARYFGPAKNVPEVRSPATTDTH